MTSPTPPPNRSSHRSAGSPPDHEQEIELDDRRWTGVRDGFGDREFGVDGDGRPIELLRLRADIDPAEPALLERVVALMDVNRLGLARARRVVRDDRTDRLVVVSDRVAGIRLSELIVRAEARSSVADVGVALSVMRQLLRTAGVVQRASGVAHLAIAPERIVVTPRGGVAIVEAVIAAAIEVLADGPTGVPHGLPLARADADAIRLGARVDIARVALTGMALMLGRALDHGVLIDPLSAEVQEVAEVAAIRSGESYANALRVWIEQAISPEAEFAFPDFDSAREALATLSPPRESGCAVTRRGLVTFVHELMGGAGADAELRGLDRERISVLFADRSSCRSGSVSIDAVAAELGLPPRDAALQESTAEIEAREQAERAEQEAVARKRAEEEAARKRAAEEAAARKKAEDEAAARKRAEEEAARKRAADEAAARKKAEDEAAARKRAEEEAARKRAADEAAARKKAEDEAAARKRAEEEAARKRAADEAAARKWAEEEAAAQKRAEQEAAARKRAAEEAAARKKADEEAARKRAEEEAARTRPADEAAARKRADDEAAARKRAEEGAAPDGASREDWVRTITAQLGLETGASPSATQLPAPAKVEDENPSRALARALPRSGELASPASSPQVVSPPATATIPATGAAAATTPEPDEDIVGWLRDHSGGDPSPIPAPPQDAATVEPDPGPPLAERLGRFAPPPVVWKGAIAAVIVLAAGAGLFFGGRSLYTRATTPGVVIVESTPPGANVRLNGVPRGQTPVTLQMRPGEHRIDLALAGVSKQITVDVGPGTSATQRVDFTAAKPVGTLEITSEPPGAVVVLDGEPRGTTPVTLTDVPAGRRRVVFQSANGTVTRQVDVSAGDTQPVHEAIFAGWVAVYAPFELQVYENKRLIGSTESGQIMLPPGSHRIDLVSTRLGYSESRVVQVDPGETTAINVKATEGVIRVEAPAGAEVLVDGEPAGRTPLDETRAPIGTREVVVRHPDIGEYRTTVIVTAAQPAVVNALEPRR